MHNVIKLVSIVGLFLIGPTWASAWPVKLTDDRGRVVQLSKAPQRIISLLPSLSESVCALGACEKIVGTDRFSDFPERLKSLPKLGDLDDLQWERLKALKPDLVLASRAMRQVERLEALGIQVIALDSKSHQDVERSLRLLAHMLGDPEAGDRLWRSIDQAMKSAKHELPASLKEASVYVEVGPSMHAAGPDSFLGQSLQVLGLRNVVPASMGSFPQLSIEWLLGAQPGWIVLQADPSGQYAKRPGWRGLKAIQQGRLCALPGPQFDLLVRPGPRLGQAAQVLADCLTLASTKAT